jgi:hypothetical protein
MNDNLGHFLFNNPFFKSIWSNNIISKLFEKIDLFGTRLFNSKNKKKGSFSQINLTQYCIVK